MRKIAAIENVTLDGFADSQEGLGFEWTARAYDDEVDRYSNEHVREDVDTAMYGRATYLGMQGFWSQMVDNPQATPTERAHAEWVNNVDKVVFSTTLKSADWANSRLISGNVVQEVATLRAQPGGTMAIYASPRLVSGFVALGLIDEFRILVHPVTLGRGTPLFDDKSPSTRLCTVWANCSSCVPMTVSAPSRGATNAITAAPIDVPPPDPPCPPWLDPPHAGNTTVHASARAPRNPRPRPPLAKPAIRVQGVNGLTFKCAILLLDPAPVADPTGFAQRKSSALNPVHRWMSRRELGEPRSTALFSFSKLSSDAAI